MRTHALLLAGPILTVATASVPAANVNEFIDFSLRAADDSLLLPGRLHIPADYAADPNVPRPIILFLHGAGESGTNNTSQVNGNIDNLLAAAKNRGAFLYAPQTNAGWSSSTILSWAMTMVDRAINDYSADTNRFYVTGLSMGGGGTWNFLNQYSDRVAAAVPICGSPPAPGFQPANLLEEPIWAFHGRSDHTVPVSVTRNVINSFLAEAGQPLPTYPTGTFDPNTLFDFQPLNLRYTDMRGGHGIWPEVYDQARTGAMYDWLFFHHQVPEPTIALQLSLAAALASLARYRRPARHSGAR